MNAPWKQYPELGRGMGWRMGYGEDYMDFWVMWYTGVISGEEREAYRALNPEPEAWLGFYDGMPVDDQ